MIQTERHRAGFTLIELLVAMAILSIIFLVISQITSSMNSSSALLNSKSELAQDGQIVQRLLVGRLSEAIYVFPAGQTFELSSSGATTQNTVRSGAGQQWTVNSDPFVAMVLPPEAPTYTAGSNVPNNCTASNSDGCYRFYAYYAMRRSALAAAVLSPSNPDGLSPSSVPPVDARNPDAWVLMQYKANLVGWTPGYTNPAQGIAQSRIDVLKASNLYKSQAANLLADYVQPQANNGGTNDLFPASSPAATTDNCLVFCVTRTPTSTPVSSNNGTVEVRFRLEQNVGGLKKPVRVDGTNPAGGSIPYLGGVTSPRNWWPTP